MEKRKRRLERENVETSKWCKKNEGRMGSELGREIGNKRAVKGE